MNRRIVMALCALTLALGACDTQTKPDTTTTEQSAPTEMLEIREVVVAMPDGSPFFTLHEDGRFELTGKNGSFEPGHYTTLSSNGVVTRADSGAVLFTLRKDGTIVTPAGSISPISVYNDGTTINSESPEPLDFDETGNFGQDGKRLQVIRLTQGDSPRFRRAIALAFVSFLIYAQETQRK